MSNLPAFIDDMMRLDCETSAKLILGVIKSTLKDRYFYFRLSDSYTLCYQQLEKEYEKLVNEIDQMEQRSTEG